MQLRTTKLDEKTKQTLQKSQWRLAFGGSFDPVHLGHTNLVVQLLSIFNPKCLHLIPCKTPALKDKFNISVEDRLKMLELAFKQMQTKVFIDKREINRQGVSYTFDTLKEMRDEIGAQAPLAFVIGSDLLEQLDLWYKIEEFHQLANLVVIKRPGDYLKKVKILENFVNLNSKSIEKSNGSLVVLELQNLYKISSSFIRKELTQGKGADYILAPKVLNYIKQKNLYNAA